jgi:hypothetical protein
MEWDSDVVGKLGKLKEIKRFQIYGFGLWMRGVYVL